MYRAPVCGRVLWCVYGIRCHLFLTVLRWERALREREREKSENTWVHEKGWQPWCKPTFIFIANLKSRMTVFRDNLNCQYSSCRMSDLTGKIIAFRTLYSSWHIIYQTVLKNHRGILRWLIDLMPYGESKIKLGIKSKSIGFLLWSSMAISHFFAQNFERVLPWLFLFVFWTICYHLNLSLPKFQCWN